MLVPFLVSLELNEILYKQQHLSIVPIFLMLPLLALLSPSHYLQFDNHLQTGCHKHFRDCPSEPSAAFQHFRVPQVQEKPRETQVYVMWPWVQGLGWGLGTGKRTLG